jgi:AcrR family transcriptional regulator
LIDAQAPDDSRPAERHPSGRYAQKRELILDAASRKFNVMGVRGATLEDIARDVGMNLTSIRHYFRRKDDLVAAGFLRSIDVHEAAFRQALDAGPREARVRELIRVYFNLRRSIREGGGPEVMVFGDMRSLEDTHAAEVWPRYEKLFQLVRRIVSADEELAQDRPRANARTYFVLSQLLRSVFWLPAYPVDSFGWVEQRFADILFNGLAAPGVTPHPVAFETPQEAPQSSWESFLLAATKLVNQQGYRGASVDAIARQLNRTKGSFYHHVEGKGDLLAACFNRSLGLLTEAQRTAIATHGRGLDQAHAATLALVRRQQTAAGPLLRSSALMSVETAKRDAMLEELAQVVTRFSAMVTDGMIDGSCRPCDARVAGEMIMVAVNSAGQLGNWAKGVTPDTAVDYYVRPMFLGLYA